MTEPELERLAAELADAKALDWSSAGNGAAPRGAALSGLQELAQLADGFRRIQRVATGPQAPRPAPLFRFGPLEVIAKLDEGSQGEVFRAYDPLLDHYVALKL